MGEGEGINGYLIKLIGLNSSLLKDIRRVSSTRCNWTQKEMHTWLKLSVAHISIM